MCSAIGASTQSLVHGPSAGLNPSTGNASKQIMAHVPQPGEDEPGGTCFNQCPEGDMCLVACILVRRMVANWTGLFYRENLLGGLTLLPTLVEQLNNTRNPEGQDHLCLSMACSLLFGPFGSDLSQTRVAMGNGGRTGTFGKGTEEDNSGMFVCGPEAVLPCLWQF